MDTRSLAIVGVVAVVVIAAIAIGYGFMHKDNPDEVTDGINYYGNGGVTDSGKAVFGVKESHIVAANRFSKDGALFDSWNTMADGSGDTYLPGYDIDYEDGTSIKLYAIWFGEGHLSDAASSECVSATCNGQALSGISPAELPSTGEAVVPTASEATEGQILMGDGGKAEETVIDSEQSAFLDVSPEKP